MNRRELLRLSAAVGAGALAGGWAVFHRASGSRSRDDRFAFNEVAIAQLRAEMDSDRLASVALTKKYLTRIGQLDHAGPALNAVIELNPDAPSIADALDQERKTRGSRGPLYGIPVLIKDNIDTHDRMTTTAGSLALEGSIAPHDSFLTQRLREAGAVILGKTNLSEWANFRSSHSTSGWSGRGGLTRNPYALDRNPSGSSAGSAVAVAANLCSVAIGTETDGSILSPASVCGIVGIKPTVGLISRVGIIPISHSQDTAGPMARTVTDAATLLGALTGVDSRDSASEASAEKLHHDYTQFLDPAGLRGARIGVARKFFRIHNEALRQIESALDAMKRAGAVIVDPADLPSHGKIEGEFDVMLYEFKADLNAYLAGLESNVRVHSLEEIIAFNEQHKGKEMPFFGQETFLRAQEKGLLEEQAYRDALEKSRKAARDDGIDAVMNEHRLDALLAPTTGPAGVTDLVHGDRNIGGSSQPAAVAGYPSITVPAGFVHGLPFGISFFGRAWSEPVLLKIAFAFEQLTHARRAPQFVERVLA